MCFFIILVPLGLALSLQQRTRMVEDSELLNGVIGANEVLDEKSKPWPEWVIYVIWMIIFGLARSIFFG